MIDNNMTIVFIGYDGYSDMWDDCIKLIKQFWKDCPYKILFVNNEKQVNWDGVEVINAGKNAEWSRKVQIALENTSSPYICLLLEDFLVGADINNDVIKDVINFIINDKIKYYKLANLRRVLKNKDALYDKKCKYLHIIPQADEYGISLQPAIWEKEYLSVLLGKENYNAWLFEFNRVKEAKKLNYKEPYPDCVYDDRNILNLKHGVIQSKYLPDTIKYFKKIGINLNVERALVSKYEIFKYNAVEIVKRIMPPNSHRYIKKILEKFGMKFVSTDSIK